MLNFKKNVVVGVSISAEKGLEVAQVDFLTKTVLKYGNRPLAYDSNRRDIADIDIFKETLQELLEEMDIPKGAHIVLNIPPSLFKVVEYPGAYNTEQVNAAIEEDLLALPMFQGSDVAFSAVKLPNSTIQFNKYTYMAASKVTIIEVVMLIRDLGYNLVSIDTSVNSTLNAMIYNERVNTAPDMSWVLLLVENNFCKIVPMLGSCYLDCYDERISIGDVLGDEENYSTVLNAINPVLKNLPSKCLYVVSKTNVISAKALAEKISYAGRIIHEEANIFSQRPFLDIAPGVDENIAKTISLDVIGAAINEKMKEFYNSKLNLYNSHLGDIYTSYQPLEITVREKNIVFSVENMTMLSIIIALIAAALLLVSLIPLNTFVKQKESQLQTLNKKIADIDRFLAENNTISSSLFDEGDEIRIGLNHNKNIYSYYTIVGTEIPHKLWLTYLQMGDYTTIEGQADNLESIYSFFRNIKDYNPGSAIKLQKLGLAGGTGLSNINPENGFDTDSILTSMDADYYEFRISDAPEEKQKVKETGKTKSKTTKTKTGTSPKKAKSKSKLPDLEPID